MAAFIFGDPMEKTTLEALEWQISQGSYSGVALDMYLTQPMVPRRFGCSFLEQDPQFYIHRRFQFSSLSSA
ncbi:hypothetical protein JVT61DRAFT_12256 [Boletus reticuloceps]|uniref:Uncharacterized protein n=1 Tax=Boletus reticuloceps TaxID=495285 RepID=A0A8I2YEB5_9AGAM|nr:hypothetical protein JVT61DRAFT_12256 [Boletus reticuloceps]